MFLRSILLALVAGACLPGASHAAESYDGCTGFIDSVPVIIQTPGTWCLRRDLATGIASGQAIRVMSENVTIDCNDYKLGNLAAGKSTRAQGIDASNQAGVSVRRCNIRGFSIGILMSAATDMARFRVEDNVLDGATQSGIWVGGDGSLIRGNVVSTVGGSPSPESYIVGIYAEGATDVLDNTVSNIRGGAAATYGIYAVGSDGSIVGNRVREVLADVGYETIGVNAMVMSARLSLRDNEITSTHGAGYGLVCSDASSRARRNVIGGFSQGMAVCGDAGGNDVTD